MQRRLCSILFRMLFVLLLVLGGVRLYSGKGVLTLYRRTTVATSVAPSSVKEFSYIPY